MENRFLRSQSPPEGQAKYRNNILPTAYTKLLTWITLGIHLASSNDQDLIRDCNYPSHNSIPVQKCDQGTIVKIYTTSSTIRQLVTIDIGTKPKATSNLGQGALLLLLLHQSVSQSTPFTFPVHTTREARKQAAKADPQVANPAAT